MLVVASNWGLSDGTLVRGAATRLGWLPAAIHRAVMRAGFRRDGSYRPVDDVNLVLAGDTFDWLVSDAWSGPVRPWQAGRSAGATRQAVAARALWAARGIVGRLVRWTRAGVPVSAADGRGRPDWTTTRTVPMRLTLLAGDRDPWLAEVAVPTRKHPFVTGVSWSEGMLSVRHGHEFDPVCCVEAGSGSEAWGRPPTVAESVAVDLVVPFAVRLRSCAATWRVVRPLIPLLAACRPLDMPALLAGWARAAVGDGVGGVLHDSIDPAWRRAVHAWAEAARRSNAGCAADFDAVGSLCPLLENALSPVAGAAVASAAIGWRLAPAPDRGPVMSLLGHQACESVTESVPGDAGDGGLETTGPAPRSARPAAWIRFDERDPIRWERLESATGAPAVVTIDRPHVRCPAGGRVVDAA